MLTWLWFVFQLSQLAVLVLGLAFVAWTMWREFHLGNDLTYWGLARLVALVAVVSSLGCLLPIFIWAAYRTGDVEIERGAGLQPRSVYERVGKERILLRGSHSAKVLRNLTANWERE